VFNLSRNLVLACNAILLLASVGCSSTQGNKTSNAISLSFYGASSSATLTPGGAAATINTVVTRSSGDLNSVTLSVSGAPAGLTATITQPAYGTYGSISLSSSTATVPGIYSLTINASDGSVTASLPLTATVVATDAVTLTLANNTLLVRQDGTAASSAFTVSHSFGNTNPITVSATSLPAGLSATYSQPGTGTTGSVIFTAVPPSVGTYPITLTASDGTVSSTATVTLTVEVVMTVANAMDPTLGRSGMLQQFMSTSFQPNNVDNFFTTFPTSTTDIAALGAKHLRVQPVGGATPWVTNSTTPQSTDWNFSSADQTIQPLLTVGDESPIFQITVAPSFLCDSNGHFINNTANLALLTTYAQDLVLYYNKGGFTWGGKHFQSASSHPITWWTIFNEPNGNGITAAQYISIYNTLVPAMLAIDPTLKFVAVELVDYSGQSATYLNLMTLPAASGGISTNMDVFSAHYYATCAQSTTDSAAFATLAQYVPDLTYIRNELNKRSDFANVQIWTTENNVDADYPLSNGYSACTPTVLYVEDDRGTSAFFTAYRPLVFSQLGKAGNQALFHWVYNGYAPYGEVLTVTNKKTLAYWTDYWLEHTFPWDGVSAGATILKTTSTETTPSVEILATQNSDNSVSLMVTNYAVASTTDDNGAGATRTVIVDLSALGTFRTATRVDLNGSTSTVNGPTSTAITPTATMTLTFNGYGSSFFTLKP
jgi:hypothetical protein